MEGWMLDAMDEPTVGSRFARDTRAENWLRRDRDADLPSQSSQAVQPTGFPPWTSESSFSEGWSAEEEHIALLPREGVPRLHLSPHKGALSLELRAQGARKLPLGSLARPWL